MEIRVISLKKENEEYMLDKCTYDDVEDNSGDIVDLDKVDDFLQETGKQQTQLSLVQEN